MVSAREGEARLASKESKSRMVFIQALLQTNRPRRDRTIIALRGPGISCRD
jgi:hypothetical protein